MITRTLTLALAAVALLTVDAVNAQAQVTASSYSSGGTAISTASGRGNTRLNASAFAVDGGYARANMRGNGRNGGFASGNATAMSAGGVAIANGRSNANGWGSRSHVDSAALSTGGMAISNGRAIANGPWSNARAESVSMAEWGQYSNTRATAIDNRNTWSQPQPVYTTPGYYYGN